MYIMKDKNLETCIIFAKNQGCSIIASEDDKKVF